MQRKTDKKENGDRKEKNAQQPFILCLKLFVGLFLKHERIELSGPH